VPGPALAEHLPTFSYSDEHSIAPLSLVFSTASHSGSPCGLPSWDCDFGSGDCRDLTVSSDCGLPSRDFCDLTVSSDRGFGSRDCRDLTVSSDCGLPSRDFRDLTVSSDRGFGSREGRTSRDCGRDFNPSTPQVFCFSQCLLFCQPLQFCCRC
jgi:hypothetical protein